MAKKKAKLSTPAWIMEGYDSEADYNKAKGIKEKKKGKTYKIKICPKCKSDRVGLVLTNSDSEQGGGKDWECKDCKWNGSGIDEKELTGDEFMEYLDKKEAEEEE